MPFIDPPKKMPFWTKLLIQIGDRVAGKKLTPPRILAWYPKALVSSGIFEGLITHEDRQVSRRLLQLVRLQVSFAVACPFCIDINARGYRDTLADAEIESLQGVREMKDIPTFTDRERTALEYTRALCRTPVTFEEGLIDRMKSHFSEREMVIIAATAAQVNYWTRLNEGFGILPDGFSENCPILRLDKYSADKTLR